MSERSRSIGVQLQNSMLLSPRAAEIRQLLEDSGMSHALSLIKLFGSLSRAVARPVKKGIEMKKIELTTREGQLQSLLLDVARYIDESKLIKERLELRFAGGWVRDKLLDIPSHDIDTAISGMTGYNFSLKIKEYLNLPINLSKHNLTAHDVGQLHKIAANPEKSKHLETATTKILGLEVDFVNLRKETYSADSRNPQMEFGTPKEDALRRDATVNSLFYNLHTMQVEDFTGGLADLQSKIIRTPLEPFQTFLDDPLRVLRLIRFASRLNFTIDTASEACMRDREIQAALRTKISRERVGIEIDKMLKSQNPQTALQLIDRIGLYFTIFTDPTTKGMPEPSIDRWKVAYECLDQMRLNRSPGSVYALLVISEEAANISWILAALAPWLSLGLPSPNSSGVKRPLPYATSVAREGIKQNNRVCEIVSGATRNLQEILTVKHDIILKKSYVFERDTLGMKIRSWEQHGGSWRLHALVAVLIEAMRSDTSDGSNTLHTEFEKVQEGWQKFVDHLQEMDLLDAPSWKRPIDGSQLAKALNAQPGIWMTAALDVCMAWRFRNPTATDTSPAIEEVRAKAKDLGIPI